MTRESGAARIFFYNWPIYVATWAGAAGVLLLVPLWLPAYSAYAVPVVLLAAGALLWSVGSLVISFYIYDRSCLSGGTWVPPLLPASTRAWAMIHAGLDAEIYLDAVMPGTCVARLDVFDPRYMSAGSIRRARRRTAPARASLSCSPTALAMADGTCDAVVVVFTAHEVRDRPARVHFFAEVRRALRPAGRALLVEHVRDLANFLAFGPGFFHFLPHSEWLRTLAQAGLTVVGEERITPFVRVLLIERAA